MEQGRRRSFFFRYVILFLVLITSACQFLGFGGSEGECGPSTLKIGAAAYEIETIRPEADGSWDIPANKPATAYWMEGTNTNQVFALAPTEDNLALVSSLQNGDPIVVSWENCNASTYNLSAIETTVPENAVLLDQSVSQVTIFVRTDSSSGFVLTGALSGETINASNTQDPSEIQAEISILGTSVSEDGQNIHIEVSISNTGDSSFTLSPEDISLTSDNTASNPIGVEPALPYEIAPAETVTFRLTFPRPSSQTATLKILTVTYDIEGN